jgi:hypothetical protein
VLVPWIDLRNPLKNERTPPPEYNRTDILLHVYRANALNRQEHNFGVRRHSDEAVAGVSKPVHGRTIPREGRFAGQGKGMLGARTSPKRPSQELAKVTGAGSAETLCAHGRGRSKEKPAKK